MKAADTNTRLAERRFARAPKKTRRLPVRLLRSRKAVFLSLLAAAGILLFVWRERWLLPVGNFLVIQDGLHSADAILVIAGEDYRTDYAIELFKQGYGKTLFFTGGWCTTHHYFHGAHGRERSLEQGVPPKAVAFDDSGVTSTYLEVEKLKLWIARSPAPIRSVIVVSDPFHMRRARWACRRVLRDAVEVQMAPVPMDRTPFRRRWWTDPASRSYVLDEYRKLAYYILRYQISSGKLKEWLASLDRE